MSRPAAAASLILLCPGRGSIAPTTTIMLFVCIFSALSHTQDAPSPVPQTIVFHNQCQDHRIFCCGPPPPSLSDVWIVRRQRLLSSLSDVSHSFRLLPPRDCLVLNRFFFFFFFFPQTCMPFNESHLPVCHSVLQNAAGGSATVHSPRSFLFSLSLT